MSSFFCNLLTPLTIVANLVEIAAKTVSSPLSKSHEDPKERGLSLKRKAPVCMSKDEEFTFKPFSRLKDLVKPKKLPTNQPPLEKCVFPPVRIESESDDENRELESFEDAMRGVRPLVHQELEWKREMPQTQPRPRLDPDLEAQLSLQDLVKGAGEFRIADTPEYIEGVAEGVSHELVRRLHQGDFSLQARLDLHGFTVDEAEEKVNAFLLNSLNRGFRCVMLVHGRGLSSPEYPKLKEKVRGLLSRGHWCKWVIAFTSARLCDGGTGATYILLRKRPVKKRRKGSSLNEPC